MKNNRGKFLFYQYQPCFSHLC